MGKVNLHPNWFQKPGVFAYICRGDEKEEQAQRETINTYLERNGVHADKWVNIRGEVSFSEMLDATIAGDAVVVADLARLVPGGVADLASFVKAEIQGKRLRLIVARDGLDIDCSQQGALTEAQLALLTLFVTREQELLEARDTEASKQLGEKIIELERKILQFRNHMEDFMVKNKRPHTKRGGASILDRPTYRMVWELFERDGFGKGNKPTADDYRRVLQIMNEKGIVTPMKKKPYDVKSLCTLYNNLLRAKAEKDKSNDTNRPPTDTNG